MSRRLTRADVGRCLSIFAAMRVALTAWAILVLHVYPIGVQWEAPMFSAYGLAVPGGYGGGNGLWDLVLWPWYRWDTGWYLNIALEGYGPSGQAAFPPLYPWLVRGLGSMLQGHYLLAALVISNVAAFLSCLLLYKEARSIFTRTAALRTVLYFLSFPTAFFLVAAYTESLFLLFALLAWQAATDGKWVAAASWGVPCVLTRFHGIALLVPFAYLWWRSRPRKAQGLALLAIPLALVAWFFYVRFGPGGEFPWSAQGRVWREHIGWPWEGIVNNALAVFGIHPRANLSLFSISLDTLVTGLLIVLTVACFRLLPTGHALLMAVMLLIALTRVSELGLLRSMSRYSLPLFPGFILLARAGQRRMFHWPWVVVCFTLQATASALFFLWFWVA